MLSDLQSLYRPVLEQLAPVLRALRANHGGTVNYGLAHAKKFHHKRYGAHTRNSGCFTIDKSWFPTDGLVSTVTMKGPGTGAGRHGDIVGADEGWYDACNPLPWFLKQAELLASLPL